MDSDKRGVITVHCGELVGAGQVDPGQPSSLGRPDGVAEDLPADGQDVAGVVEGEGLGAERADLAGRRLAQLALGHDRRGGRPVPAQDAALVPGPAPDGGVGRLVGLAPHELPDAALGGAVGAGHEARDRAADGGAHDARGRVGRVERGVAVAGVGVDGQIPPGARHALLGGRDHALDREGVFVEAQEPRAGGHPGDRPQPVAGDGDVGRDDRVAAAGQGDGEVLEGPVLQGEEPGQRDDDLAIDVLVHGGGRDRAELAHALAEVVVGVVGQLGLEDADRAAVEVVAVEAGADGRDVLGHRDAAGADPQRAAGPGELDDRPPDPGAVAGGGEGRRRPRSVGGVGGVGLARRVPGGRRVAACGVVDGVVTGVVVGGRVADHGVCAGVGRAVRVSSACAEQQRDEEGEQRSGNTHRGTSRCWIDPLSRGRERAETRATAPT